MNKWKKEMMYYLGVLLFLIFSLGPILWCFIVSLTPESEMLTETAKLLPEHITWDNYKDLIFSTSQAHQALTNGFFNSLKIAFFVLIIGLPICVLAGYALAHYDFFAKRTVLNFILLTIVIPVFSTIIPIYAMFLNIRLTDHVGATTLVYISSFMPLNIWIFMNYFKALPKELWQAAALDGFTPWGTFIHIILPISAPIVMTCSLILFLMSWKQYTIPVILMASYENKVITMVMSEFMTRDAIKYGMVAASGILSVIVPALVAVVFKKFLVQGLTSGAVKQ